jgi:alpha-tubulin suppressor-like RCC1 family protein
VCIDADAAVAPCGSGGQACCAGDTPCAVGLSCTNNTCSSCIADVASGRHAMCVLHTDHTVWCAGENQYGQLGQGLTGAPMSTWVEVRDATSAVIADATVVSVGWELACAVRTGGTVWCWGLGGFGQMGNNASSGAPAAVQVLKGVGQPLTDIVEVSGGKNHNCARDTSGAVWCWGRNNFGQIGDGTTTDRNVATPVLDSPGGPALTGALALDVGSDHNCLMKANKALWCWGFNGRGQLADGSQTQRPNPVSAGSAEKFSTGVFHTCIMKTDGSVACAGDVWRNRIGNGAAVYDTGTGFYSTPEPVLVAPGGAPLAGVTNIVAGGVSCALMADTTVQCWGDNNHGQAGTGGGSTTPTPVITSDGKPLTGVDRIVTQFARVCVHKTTGEWLCWGRNLEGAFGDGTFVNHPLPTVIKGGCP